MEEEMYFRKMAGEKCYLSPIDMNDAEKYTAWMNDLEVTINLETYNSVINVESEKAFLETLSCEHNYSIIDKETDELLGICGFRDIDLLNQTAEVGIFIGNKDYWGKGYGTEALSLLLDIGFKTLNLHNVQLRVNDYNKRAIRAYEKVGFMKSGVRREAVYRNLERHDFIFMDILSSEFYNIHTKTTANAVGELSIKKE
jgi:RimJ/RimL family protein N-acetyltransferase